MKVKHEWHTDFFKDSFYNPATPAAVAQAPMEVDFILNRLRLRKEARLLDLCCGPARHAALIARKGLNVTGYDFSADYLKEAAARAKEKKTRLDLIRGDMRELNFNSEFDAVISLFTSFGYFQKFSDDMKVLKGVSRALKPGGQFMIDVVHGDFIRGNFRARDWRLLENGSYCLEESVLTNNKTGMFSTWTVISKTGKSVKKSFFSRLYGRRTLASALTAAGLKPLKFWGSFHGDKLTDKADRLIILAMKPGKIQA